MNAIASATDIGTLADVLSNTQQVKQSISLLTEQSSTGLLAEEYAGLGSNARGALDLSLAIALNTATQSNLDQAATLQQVTQSALGQIQSLVTSFSNQLLTAPTYTPNTVDVMAADARGTLSQIAALLNTRIGDVYVFAGQDSRDPPVPAAASITQSAFFTAIQGAVAGLAANGAAAVTAQTLAIAQPGATSPFAATLEASNLPASTDLGGGLRLQLGVLADRNSDAVSSGIGSTSTGSYTRDIFQVLATIGSLSSSQASDPQFSALLQSSLTTLQGAGNALNTDIGGLGLRQDQLAAAKTELGATATALSTQLGNVQDADLAKVSTELSNAQTALQASYHVISALGQLSLAKFLPA